MAKRIQRRRVKGWRMPEGAKYIGRPTAWGNPYKVGVHGDAAECVEMFRRMVEGMMPVVRRAYLAPLRGKDLACFCPLDQPCHADILLELLAEQESSDELAQHWPQMPELDGVDLFSDYPITGGSQDE